MIIVFENIESELLQPTNEYFKASQERIKIIICKIQGATGDTGRYREIKGDTGSYWGYRELKGSTWNLRELREDKRGTGIYGKIQ